MILQFHVMKQNTASFGLLRCFSIVLMKSSRLQKIIHVCVPVFRVHAEFQINEPPNYPFWFTPAQFTGRIIISKEGTHILDFEMFVPNDKKLNVGEFTTYNFYILHV